MQNLSKSMLIACLALLALLSFSGISPAAQTFFGEDLGLGEYTPLASWPNALAARNSFSSHLSGMGTESLETFADGTTAPLFLTFSGAGTAFLVGSGSIDEVPAGQTNGFGRYGTSPTKYWESGSSFYIDFLQPVAAFGFYGIDIGDSDGQVTATLTKQGGGYTLYTIPSTINGEGGAVLFWGVIDAANPFTRVAFDNTNSGTDYFGFDDMVLGLPGQVVPLPGTMVLLGSGLVGLSLLRRWRRRF